MVYLIRKCRSIAAITIYLAIAMIVICLVSACQPTPEKTVVIQKDNFEELIENTAQSASQLDSVDAKHIIWDSDSTQEYPNGTNVKISVKVDAFIDARQSTASVFLVEPDEYDLDFAQRAAAYFLGDEYYEGLYTKEDILQLRILPLKLAIQKMKDDRSASNAESFLNTYQRQYERAPENNEPGQIVFKNAEGSNEAWGFDYEYMTLKSYPYQGAVCELYVGNGEMIRTSFYYYVEDGKTVYRPSNHKYSGTPARNMQTSYEDAKKMAEEAMREFFEGSMSLVQTELYNARVFDENWAMFSGSPDITCAQAYMFMFTPVYGGLAQLYAPEASNANDMMDEGVDVYEQKWDYEYSMKWPAQYVQVLVDDNGIVQIWEFSPTRITKIVNDNVAMLSFDEIFETFKENIFFSSAWTYPWIASVDIEIDSIVFGMIRVPIKDNPDQYYMVPAWQFAGTKTEISMKSSEDDYTESGKTFLVLNALDGSIIDTSYYENNARSLEKQIGLKKF